jgi:hypothetical protein
VASLGATDTTADLGSLDAIKTRFSSGQARPVLRKSLTGVAAWQSQEEQHR